MTRSLARRRYVQIDLEKETKWERSRRWHITYNNDSPRRVGLFPAIDLYDTILVHILENVRRVHENSDGAGGGDYKEDVKLQSIDHHRDVLPVFSRLKRRCKQEGDDVCVWKVQVNLKLARLTHLYVQVFVPEMFCYELHSFGGLAGFRVEQHRIRTLGPSPVAHPLTAPSATRAARSVLHFAIDLAIGMMQIWQLHHLHLLRRQLWYLGRASRVCGSWQCYVRYLHHPSGEVTNVRVSGYVRLDREFSRRFSEMNFNYLYIFKEDVYLNQGRNLKSWRIQESWQFNRYVSIFPSNFLSTYTHSKQEFVVMSV